VTAHYRKALLGAAKKYYEAKIEFHKVNADIILDNVVSVGDHSNVMETLDKEIEIIASYRDKLEVLNNIFE
jgi:hypothetical protein